MAALAGTKVGTGYIDIEPSFSGFQEKVGRRLATALAPQSREIGKRISREMAKGVDGGHLSRALAPFRRRFEKVGDEAGKAMAAQIGRGARKAEGDMFGLAGAIAEVERRTKKASSASRSLESDMFGIGRAAKASGRQVVSARTSLRDWHRQAQAGSQSAARLRDRVRGLAAELRNSGREARAAGGGFGGINGGMARVNRSFSFFRNILRTLKWPILLASLGLAAQGLSALAAGAVAATSALGPLAGALVTLPAAAIAGAQAFGALKLATAGVGDAVKAALDVEIEGGSQAADVMGQQRQAAEQVADAKRNLTNVQRLAKYAQEDLTEARKDARRELQDMELAARGAGDAEQQAVLQLQQAKKDLRETFNDPEASTLDRRFAEEAVDQARTDLQQTRLDAKRAREDYGDARKAGVDGMPEVVAAKRAEADANRAIVDAERDLRRAVDDGNAAMAEQGAAASTLHEKMSQLPPAAQAFVRTLVALKPRLDALRATAAEGFFPGATKGLHSLLGNFSEVRTVVGETADVFGHLAARAGRKLGSAVWGKDLLRIGRLNTKVLDRMGDSGLNLADAFRHILVSARPFLNWLSKGTVKLSEWIEGETQAARESGRLADFFDRTRKSMELLSPILKGVGGGLLNVGEAARPLGNQILGALGDSAEGWRRWTDSVKGENRLKRYFTESKPAIFEMGRLIRDAGKAFFELGRQRGVAHLLRLVRTQLLPALTDLTGAVTGWASDFLRQFGQLRKEGVPTFEAFVRVLVDHAGQAGWAIAKALVSSFIHAGIWGKLAVTTWLIHKLGGFKAFAQVGAEAGGRLGKSIAQSAWKWIAGTEAGASLIGRFQDVFGRNGRFGKVVGTAGTRMGVILGRSMALGAIAGLVLFAPAIRDAIDKYIKDPLNEALGGVFGDSFKGVLSKAQDLIDPANLGPVPTALGLDVKGFVKGKVLDVSEMFTGTTKAEDRLRKFSSSVGREADRARLSFRTHLDALPGIAERSSRGINQQFLPRLGHLTDEGGQKGAAFARSLGGHFRSLSGNVGSALQSIIENTGRALKSLGVKGAVEKFALKHPTFTYGTGTSPNLAEKQGGGAVLPPLATGGLASVVPGTSTGDRHTLSINGVPVAKVESREGIFVGNRNLMAAMQRANDAVPRFQGGGLLKGLQRGGFPGVSGDTDFLPALGFGLSKMARTVGRAIFVQSGRRTLAEQSALYDAYRNGTGNLAAAPSPTAPHVRGIAADITPGQEVFGGAASRFGLGFTVPSESWHIELLNAALGARAGGAAIAPKIARKLLAGPAGPLKKLGQAAMDKAWKAGQGLVDKHASFGGFGFGAGGGAWEQVLQQIAGARGWSAADWMELVMRESGGNPAAVNPTSGAYGLGQFLGATKDAYAKYGAASPRGVDQIRAMAKYIADRYGDPTAALSFHDSHNWYKRGGLLKLPGLQTGGAALAGSVSVGKRAFKEIRSKLGKVASAGLSGETLGQLTGLTGDAERFSEFASNASALTFDPTGEGKDPILGIFQGGNEENWLDKTLLSLLELRNVLLRAHEAVATQREALIQQLHEAFQRIKAIREAVQREQERRGSLVDRMGDIRKALEEAQGQDIKDRLRAQLRDVADRISLLDLQQGERKDLLQQFVGKVVPGLKGKRDELGETLGALLRDGGEGYMSLEQVQGKGGPMEAMSGAPGVGVLGGEILSVQQRLRDLRLPQPTETVDDSERVSLLEGLLLKERTEGLVANVQGFALEGWDKLRQGIRGNFGLQLGGPVLPPFGGIAHTGAIVPGPRGAERTMITKAGEGIFTEEQMAAMGTGSGDVQVIVNGEIRQEPGDTRPAIEVRRSDGSLAKQVQATPGTGRRHPSAFRTRP